MTQPVELKHLVGLATLQRPRFSAGLLLEDEDLTAAVDYTRNMTRLLFRSLFGCGIICGLEVDAKRTCHGTKVLVTVKKGVALDCVGNPIEVPSQEEVTYDADCKKMEPEIWVVVCYVEKCCRPRDISCSPDDDGHAVPTRTRDGFEIKLYDSPPTCACSCAPAQTPKGDPRSGKCCTAHGEGGGNAAGTEPAADGTVKTLTAEQKRCSCYDAHHRGVCACDCGCRCVVIGKISTQNGKDGKPLTDLSVDNPLEVDNDTRRLIRPVLIGYGDGPCAKEATSTDPSHS